jgi:hypothetical protein
MVVVTPTLKGARVAAQEAGVAAFSAAWLAHQHGWRWDDEGRWTRVAGQPDPGAVLCAGDLLVVDEAGMLDQDTARALLTLADDAGARVALLGDRHQLPAGVSTSCTASRTLSTPTSPLRCAVVRRLVRSSVRPPTGRRGCSTRSSAVIRSACTPGACQRCRAHRGARRHRHHSPYLRSGVVGDG